MKQILMFPKEEKESKYNKVIGSPIYEPHGSMPIIHELTDKRKTSRIINQINRSNLPEEEKMFLRDAAQRHTVFDYEKIAEYYCHSSKEMQDLMERSALVIIDYQKAIEFEFMQLTDKIRDDYLTEYNEEDE